MRDIRDPLGVILCVVGARPNYMKMAPLLHDFKWRRMDDTFLGAKLA